MTIDKLLIHRRSMATNNTPYPICHIASALRTLTSIAYLHPIPPSHWPRSIFLINSHPTPLVSPIPTFLGNFGVKFHEMHEMDRQAQDPGFSSMRFR